MAALSGGQKLEAELAKLAARLGTEAHTLRVGFLENAQYPSGMSVAAVAAIQDLGAPRAKIPPRPFFRNMIAAKKGEWAGALAALIKTHGYDAKTALAMLGDGIAGQLRESIINTNAPPLSPITLMLRKMFGNHPEAIRGRDVGEAAARVAAGESPGGVSSKPLVWTGHLLDSVDFDVK